MVPIFYGRSSEFRNNLAGVQSQDQKLKISENIWQ